MDKIELTKRIVNQMTGYSIGAATAAFLHNNRKHSDKLIIEIILDLSVFVTAIAVGGVVHEPIRDYTDAQIEKAFAKWEEIKEMFQK
jgi:hypothetical protein